VRHISGAQFGSGSAENSRQVKILLVHNSYQQPGGEDVVFDLERQMLESRGHQVVTYRRSNWEIEAYSCARRLTLLPNVVWATDSRREIARLLEQGKFQVVHVHNTFIMVSPSIYSACRRANVPVVQTLHNYRLLCPGGTFFRDGRACEECVEHSLWRGVRYGCYRDSSPATAAVALMLAVHRMRNTWMRDVDCYVALTEFSRRKFVEGGLPPEKVCVKPNFIHPDPSEHVGDREYALFVGRLSPEKQLHTLFAAWERLHNRIPLFIIGSGPQRAEIEAQAARRNLSGVRFLGQVGRDQALAAIKRARFLIFPSGGYQNFPMTIVEAFACGTPVICSRLGAMEEIVADGYNGLHFAPLDSDDLATKVDWAWAHPEQMERMGKEARREYQTKYTAERNHALLMEIYARAIANGARAQN
jgi:glycosyltransferase involved in cell wall biosynthesis